MKDALAFYSILRVHGEGFESEITERRSAVIGIIFLPRTCLNEWPSHTKKYSKVAFFSPGVSENSCAVLSAFERLFGLSFY